MYRMPSLLCLSLVLSIFSALAKKPNVVLLILDDIGWADVGYHGGNFPTPNIDSLARNGVMLNRMYVLPQCSPSRSSMMTGRYAFRMGLQHFETLFPGTTGGIPDGVPTIGDTFKSAGYSTHYVGKWHLGYSKWTQTPLGKGFDSFYGYLQGETDYYKRTFPSCDKSADLLCIYKENNDSSVKSPLGPNADGYDFWDDRAPLWSDLGKYTIDAYEKRLDSILTNSSQAAEPLFLVFAEQQLHIPLQSPPEEIYQARCQGVKGGSSRVNRTTLCSMASRLDDTVGRLVAMLKSKNLWQDTLIFVSSDNGGMTHWGEGFPASASSNFPLRGGKTTLFEGGVRAVSFVTGGALPAEARGQTRHDLLHAVDILPTLASFAKVPLPAGLDGRDAWETIAHGKALGRTELPLNIDLNPLGGLPPSSGLVAGGGTNYSALIAWPWKLIVGSPTVRWKQVEEQDRTGYWTIHDYRHEAPPVEAGDVRLYNIEEDEEERKNLAASKRPLVEHLLARLQWYTKAGNGFVASQDNLPQPLGNPVLHNWTWSPFVRIDSHEIPTGTP